MWMCIFLYSSIAEKALHVLKECISYMCSISVISFLLMLTQLCSQRVIEHIYLSKYFIMSRFSIILLYIPVHYMITKFHFFGIHICITQESWSLSIMQLVWQGQISCPCHTNCIIRSESNMVKIFPKLLSGNFPKFSPITDFQCFYYACIMLQS